ncbi:uncharacterized protein [Primulina eburnea]|uniref:uncharacterized protein n=1 Tax=Primulina eburnea TaxID=1245227 RepID=UPI003C6C9D8C
MKRNNIMSFFKPIVDNLSSPERTETHASPLIEKLETPSKSQRVEFDEISLEQDPELHISMWRHSLNHRDEIRRIKKNRLRLAATIESVCWLNLQACGLKGHDESSYSQNRGNFIEMLKLLGKWNASIGDVILDKAPGNARYTSPKVPKEILLERFFQIVHVHDTTVATLKKEICDVLNRYNLEIHNMRGQGFDCASNMSGAFNRLQALFLKDCPYAYYVHCFVHRLQLALVAAAEKEISIWLFFSNMMNIDNLVTSSSKRNADLIDIYYATINVLEKIITDGTSTSMRGEAGGSLIVMKSFDFIFILHLMHKILGITNFLFRALQQKSLDIISAMDLVSTIKELFLTLRNDGFDFFFHFQLEELNSRFSDETLELLILSSALDPKDNFKWFNIDKICTLAEKYYPEDFTEQEMHHLRCNNNIMSSI